MCALLYYSHPYWTSNVMGRSLRHHLSQQVAARLKKKKNPYTPFAVEGLCASLPYTHCQHTQHACPLGCTFWTGSGVRPAGLRRHSVIVLVIVVVCLAVGGNTAESPGRDGATCARVGGASCPNTVTLHLADTSACGSLLHFAAKDEALVHQLEAIIPNINIWADTGNCAGSSDLVRCSWVGVNS